VLNSIGSTIEGSSFSGLLTRVEIGHIRIGSAGNGRVEAAASFPAENRSGVWSLVESRAIVKTIRRGRNVTDAAFLAHSQIKATAALKKDPGQFTRPGSTELLPQLRLLAGRQGVGGWGAA
jgi:hypothetical protein